MFISENLVDKQKFHAEKILISV